LQLAGELQFFATETLWLLIFRPKRSGWDTKKMLFQLAPHAITVASGTSCTARALRLNGSKQPCPHDRMSLLIVVEHRRKEDTETQILAQAAHSDILRNIGVQQGSPHVGENM
jgi:hypothetical protein